MNEKCLNLSIVNYTFNHNNNNINKYLYIFVNNMNI